MEIVISCDERNCTRRSVTISYHADTSATVSDCLCGKLPERNCQRMSAPVSALLCGKLSVQKCHRRSAPVRAFACLSCEEICPLHLSQPLLSCPGLLLCGKLHCGAENKKKHSGILLCGKASVRTLTGCVWIKASVRTHSSARNVLGGLRAAPGQLGQAEPGRAAPGWAGWQDGPGRDGPSRDQA